MADARVQSAISHWAPRFVQAGMDYSDFMRVSATVDRWEDWLDTFAALGDRHAQRAEEAEHVDRRVTAGEAWLHAAVAYHFAKFVWMVDTARAGVVADRAVAAIYAAHHHLDPSAERIEASLDGGRVVGNLRVPWYDEDPPLVLLIPGLDSTKEEFWRLENVFLARGMAVLSLDGPGQGEGGYTLPIRHDYEAATTAILDALDGRFDRSARSASASAATTRPAPQRSRSGSRPSPGSAAHSTSARCGSRSGADPRDVREQVRRDGRR